MRLPRPPLVGLDKVPGATASIRRARSRGGLAGFAAAFLAAKMGGAGLAVALERGLVGGVITYLVVWAAALSVWRTLVVGEARRALLRPRKGRRRSTR